MIPRVLVVDDEPRYRALYMQVLSAAGIAVAEAGSAEEALQAIAEKTPDMVVSDVRMEGASGLDLLKQVRVREAELPFLLVTAYADVRDAVIALKLGAVDYLPKPVDLDELLACVQDTLGLRPHPGSDEIPAEALAGVVAESQPMRSLLHEAWRIAQSDANILLTGESGCGKRPTWAKPIHQLMRDAHVTIFFFGHDHLFAREILDNVVYQSVPNPADNTYTAFNGDAFAPATIPFPGAAYDPKDSVVLPNSGHLQVTVGSVKTVVDYVGAVLPGDEAALGRTNGQITFSYEVGANP